MSFLNPEPLRHPMPARRHVAPARTLQDESFTTKALRSQRPTTISPEELEAGFSEMIRATGGLLKCINPVLAFLSRPGRDWRLLYSSTLQRDNLVAGDSPLEQLLNF